jgi:GH25 family lysozyme M1 (1,4-beta-N-acetylmuramidase)
MLHPIVADFAHFNPVNWDKLAQGPIKGVIHKAYQFGADDKYAARRIEAEKRGLLWGAYYFATDEAPAHSAPAYLASAKPDATTLCALDYERNIVRGVQHNMTAAAADEWCDRVEQATGRAAFLYGGDLVRERITPACAKNSAMAARFARRPLWLCQYKTDPSLRDTDLATLNKHIHVPAPWKRWTLLQYAADGHGPLPHTAPGLQNNADLNVFDGDLDALKAVWAGAVLVPTVA